MRTPGALAHQFIDTDASLVKRLSVASTTRVKRIRVHPFPTVTQVSPPLDLVLSRGVMENYRNVMGMKSSTLPVAAALSDGYNCHFANGAFHEESHEIFRQ